MARNKITISSEEETGIIRGLREREDAEAKRITRFLDMPDLTRVDGSPIKELVDRILGIEQFSSFSDVETPEIIKADLLFELFNYPADHPERSPSNTYYPDPAHILRPMTTTMWYYHTKNESVTTEMKQGKSVGALSYGKVYRKDEIDRHHMNVFHQMDGWYLTPKDKKIITIEDLKEVLVEITQTLFGHDVTYRFVEETFPYTDPSIEIEAEVKGKWVEVVGSGVVRPQLLKNLGIDADKWGGWAFGFGLERLAIISMDLPDIRLLWSGDPRVTTQLKLGQKYKEVSPYPQITRDISFVVPSTFVPNDYFDLVRDIGGQVVEEVKLIDKYEDTEKFGAGKVSYTYRIIYRSNERTLTTEEVDPIQQHIYSQTAKQFGAQLR